MEIIIKKIGELKPYKRNPRKNDEAVDAVAASIKEFGFKVPLVIDADAEIVAGHTRLKAAKKLGISEVPCIVADDLTPEQIKAFRIADNKTAELAQWDTDLLKIELNDIQLDMSDFGFESAETSISINAPTEIVEDEPPEIGETIEPLCKLGDTWKLGDHRLICGDSTQSETVAKLMNGEKADIVFTDPPYGMGKERDGVLNDNLNEEALVEFNKRWVEISFDSLKDSGSWYCWGNDSSLLNLYAECIRPRITQKEIVLRNLITWDKGSGQGQLWARGRMYAPADEKCLFVMKGWQNYSSFSINADDYSPKMDAIRLYLKGEADRLGITPQKIKEICGVGMYSHWFTKSQFTLMSRENYEKLCEYYKEQNGFARDYDGCKREYDELKKEYDELKKEYDENRAYFDNLHDNMNSVWHFLPTSQTERQDTGNHATPKPIALCARAIKSSARQGEIVLDLFGGSGSTLIACEQLERKCYMAELSPKYCDVIIRRWEKFTGKKAVKESEEYGASSD